jgi:glycosyltransferase involved in cell wall biosynthesis
MIESWNGKARPDRTSLDFGTRISPDQFLPKTVATFQHLSIVDLSSESWLDLDQVNVRETVVCTFRGRFVGSVAKAYVDPHSLKQQFSDDIDIFVETDRLRALQNRLPVGSLDESSQNNLLVYRPSGSSALASSEQQLFQLLVEDPHAACAFGRWISDSPSPAQTDRVLEDGITVWEAGVAGHTRESRLTPAQLKSLIGRSVVVLRPEAFRKGSLDSTTSQLEIERLCELIANVLTNGWRLLGTGAALTISADDSSELGTFVGTGSTVRINDLVGPATILSHRRLSTVRHVDLDMEQPWQPQLEPVIAEQLVIQPHLDCRSFPLLTIRVGSSVCVPMLEDRLARNNTLNIAGLDRGSQFPATETICSDIKTVHVRAMEELSAQRAAEWEYELQTAFRKTQIHADLATDPSSKQPPADLVILLSPSARPTAQWFRATVTTFDTQTNAVIAPVAQNGASSEAALLFADILCALNNLACSDSGTSTRGVSLHALSVFNFAYRTDSVLRFRDLDEWSENNLDRFASGNHRLLIDEQRTFRSVRSHTRQLLKRTVTLFRRRPNKRRQILATAKAVWKSVRNQHDLSALVPLCALVFRRETKAPGSRFAKRSVSLVRPNHRSIVTVGSRYAHHSETSGYERCFDQIATPLYSPNFRWRSSGTWDHLEKIVRILSDNPTYSTGALLSEIVGCVSMMFRPRTLHHQIYGETDGWLLPAIGRFRPYSATLHMPPSQFTALGVQLDRFRFSKLLIVVDPALFDFVRVALPHTPIRLIEIAIGDEFFSDNADHADNLGFQSDDAPKPYVLCVGSHLRDYDTLLRAWAKAQPQMVENLSLHIVGAPKDISDYVETLEVPGVRFRRRLSDSDLRSEYRRAQALVLPVTDATANLALLEGHASGLPVYTTDTAGARHYLGEKATYLPGRDIPAWTECFLNLAKQPGAKNNVSPSPQAPLWPRAAITARLREALMAAGAR